MQKIRILGCIDAGQATEVAFAELAKNPNWIGSDEIAVVYLWYLDLLAHPRIQEHYLKEGKWIDYLSTRVPEYAKYAPDLAE